MSEYTYLKRLAEASLAEASLAEVALEEVALEEVALEDLSFARCKYKITLKSSQQGVY